MDDRVALLPEGRSPVLTDLGVKVTDGCSIVAACAAALLVCIYCNNCTQDKDLNESSHVAAGRGVRNIYT